MFKEKKIHKLTVQMQRKKGEQINVSASVSSEMIRNHDYPLQFCPVFFPYFNSATCNKWSNIIHQSPFQLQIKVQMRIYGTLLYLSYVYVLCIERWKESNL